MSEQSALLYLLAGLFSLVLTLPLLLFWKRQGWARLVVVFTLLAAIVGSWFLFDFSARGGRAQVDMFAMTLLPPVLALCSAGFIEFLLRMRRASDPQQRRRRRSRSATNRA
jgi:predicted RND superfamily exporter protein